jgi:PAS domain S-box-containing protein
MKGSMSRPLRLLIVDDSADDAWLVLRELEAKGFTLEHLRVETEAELRDALAAQSWDAVVTDFNLPGTDGRAVLSVLREHAFTGPVIAVSGALSEEQLVSAMRNGAHDFIPKGNLTRLAPALVRELEEAATRDARRRAEQALGHTEERLRSVLQNMPVMLVAFGEGGDVRVWNRECERVTGYAAAEIVGRPEALPRLCPDPALRARLTAEWSQGRAYRDWVISMTGKDGRVRAISWSSVSASFPVPGWASWAVGTDVSERLRMEVELREANRMKDEFLATLSHELRTPLTAILGWVHLMRAGTLDASMSARALDVVERNAKSQAQLVADILDLSSMVTGRLRLEPRAFDLAPSIAAAVEAVRPAADAKNITVTVTADPRLGPFLADPDRIQQVVWNLLSNATKFTPEGGRIHLETRRRDSRLEIVVQDSGIGIAKDVLPFVFERFRQGDASSTRGHGGLGIGLAIVRHLVELHGGIVEVASGGPGQGATFTVSLPLRDVPRATAAPQAPVAPDLDGLKVLVVDDDPDTLDLVGTVLRQRGAIVTTTSDALSALASLERARPDILLSDLAMPGHDGYELIRRVRALPGGAGIRAAALTAYVRTEDRLRALWAGFETHIPKPIQPNELAAVVASLAGRMGENAPAEPRKGRTV